MTADLFTINSVTNTSFTTTQIKCGRNRKKPHQTTSTVSKLINKQYHLIFIITLTVNCKKKWLSLYCTEH